MVYYFDRDQHITKIDDVSASHSNHMCKARLLVVVIFFAFAFSVISIRLIDLSVFNGSVTVQKFVEQQAQYLHPSRSEIVDRNDVLLAINLTAASLYANPQKVLDPEEAVVKLITVFPELNPDTLLRHLQSHKSFVWIKRHLTPKEHHIANTLGIPGLYFSDEEQRIYPHGDLFSHVVGYVNVDNKGMAGVERAYNDRLNYYPQKGEDSEVLKLSLDTRVQSIVKSELKKRIEMHNALGGCAVVMDVNTGEIVAQVSLPDFNPHIPGDLNEASAFNRTTLGVYEMGSTFKTYTLALGLETGAISLQDGYDVTNPIQIDRFTIRDFHPKKGWLSIPEIFMYSSNIGTAKIAEDVGIEKQREFMKNIGLLDSVLLPFSEKSSPLYPKQWGKLHSMTISYGHGIAVSPMHVVKSTASMVNGGILYPLRITVPENNESIIGKRVISVATSKKIRKLMRLAVQFGTGSRAEANGYFVGGKTGSADKVVAGGYSESAIIASFSSVFPMYDPQYAVFVMLDEPQSHKVYGGGVTGGITAAPTVRNIIAKIGPILGVKPMYELAPDIRKEFWYKEKPSHARTISF